MLTPPYHFATVACPLGNTPGKNKDEILFRGSIPAARNLPFLKRLRLRTIVVLKKKALKEGDVLLRWAERHDVQIKWIKAEEMTEESLGMGRSEVNDVLKLILDPTLYPLYIADLDGISHTTLIMACLRKLQGWHMDSIVDEVAKFEPDHEDLPFLSFLAAYLSIGSSSDPWNLPPPPYPVWLWPSPPSTGIPLTRTITRERDRDRDRDRSNTIPPAPSNLPFPHPLQARRHPTMKLTFPAVPTSPVASTTLSREPTRKDRVLSPTNTISPSDTVGSPVVPGGSVTMSNGVSGIAQTLGRMVSFDKPNDTSVGATTDQAIPSSPVRLSRATTLSDGQREGDQEAGYDSPEDLDGDEVENQAEEQYEEDEEEELEEDDEEEDYDDDDDDDSEMAPTSLHISALDLAGYG